jgi:hypothetical protein
MERRPDWLLKGGEDSEDCWSRGGSAEGGKGKRTMGLVSGEGGREEGGILEGNVAIEGKGDGLGRTAVGWWMGRGREGREGSGRNKGKRNRITRLVWWEVRWKLLRGLVRRDMWPVSGEGKGSFAGDDEVGT